MHLEPVPHAACPDPRTFAREYLAPRRPVVLTDLARRWPALEKWTPGYLREHHGARRVRLYDASFGEPGGRYMSNVREMCLGDYLRLVLEEARDLRMFLYNLPAEIPELRRDILLPEVAGGFSERFVFMFFGCRGSVTPMHYDIDLAHVFHTAIFGRKRITLFAPEQSRNLYRHPFTVRSYVDPEQPDLERFPRAARARGFRVVLEPGQTLFIPSGHWHHVVYEEGGCAVSLRCASERWAERWRGRGNLLCLSPLDRIANKLAGRRWFGWKEARARALAAGALP